MTVDQVEERTTEQPADGVPETPPVTFDDLDISPAVLEAIREMGFELPTDVQAAAIPLALAGKDLLVQSRTGSGKTAAFAIPAASKLLDGELAQPQMLVLAPTRELAMQVEKECARIAARSSIETIAVYGGAAMGPQIDAFRRGAQLVAGTPGRVLDHIRRGNFKTDGIRLLVLDEADEMLSMGFLEEINAILDALPKERQTMLFSATIPHEIERLSERYLRDPEHIYLSEDFVGVREIDHVYYMVTGGDRPANLLRVLEFENPETALIFCNTREETSRVSDFLQSKGFATEAISSDLTQRDRERVMVRMRAGELRYLCATDIAARGIDIADLSHVINFSFPESADVYVHRTGRTGRAGRSGIAISLVSPREIGSFYYLKLIHRIYPEERHLPSGEELATRREAELLERLERHFEDRGAQPLMRKLARRLWSSLDGERLIALCLEELLEPGRLSMRREKRPEPSPRPRSESAETTQGESEGGRSDGDRGRGRGREGGRDGGRGGRDRGGRERGGRERGGREGGSRDPSSRESASRGRDGDRDRPRRDDDAAPERKTTRSRRDRPRDEPKNDAVIEGQESITTADGEVEFFETLDVPTEQDQGRSDEGRKDQGRSRREREPQAEAAPVAEGMARLYVNVGRRHDVRAEDLTSFFQIAGELSADDIGSVDQRDRHSYVAVRDELADAATERLSGKALHGRTVRVERAR